MAHGAVTETFPVASRYRYNPIPSAGSVYDDLFLFLHASTPLITSGFNS